jgi:hypothetical protein
MEDTFLWFEVEVVIEGDLENVSDCCNVSGMSVGWRCKGLGGDRYFIHVNSNSSAQLVVLCDGGAEDFVHKGLERCRGITKSEIHYRQFEQASSCFEHGLVFIAGFDMYVVVSLPDVELCEDGRSTEIVDEVSNEW